MALASTAMVGRSGTPRGIVVVAHPSKGFASLERARTIPLNVLFIVVMNQRWLELSKITRASAPLKLPLVPPRNVVKSWVNRVAPVTLSETRTSVLTSSTTWLGPTAPVVSGGRQLQVESVN